MNVNYTLMAAGIGLFAFTFIFPILARKFNNRLVKGYILTVDTMLTMISVVLTIISFSNRWWGAVIVIIVYGSGEIAFTVALGGTQEERKALYLGTSPETESKP